MKFIKWCIISSFVLVVVFAPYGAGYICISTGTTRFTLESSVWTFWWVGVAFLIVLGAIPGVIYCLSQLYLLDEGETNDKLNSLSEKIWLYFTSGSNK